MTIEKQVKICCTHSIDKTRSDSDTIWRLWKVQIRPCQRDSLSSFLDRVEYFLHESFKTPHRVCYEEPYVVQEVGWGEFDLKIVLHFRDNVTPPETFVFYLNFSKANYSEYRTFYLTGDNESEHQQKKKRRLLPASSFAIEKKSQPVFFLADESDSPQSKRQRNTSTASSCSMVTTPTDNQILSYFDDLRQQQQSGRSLKQQAVVQNQQYSCIRPHFTDTINHEDEELPLSSVPKLLPSLTTSDYIFDNDKSWNLLTTTTTEIPEEIDMALLKTNLESLEKNDDHLRKIYDILYRHDSIKNDDKTLLIETKDHIFFDLNTLNTSLLFELWEFTTKTIMKQQQEEEQELLSVKNEATR